jgi:hypothetical protein
LFDPDELGLNGPTDAPPNQRVGLPRLILAVSPTDPGEMFGCPGMVEGTKPASLMTIQESPLALAGGSAVAWPVSLEPLAVESAGNDVVESGEGGCYPGWEFLRAGWTAEGRTLEARVGFAPDVSDEERDAMVAAFASMTFEPNSAAASSVVLATGTSTGTAGGETWQLIAERQTDGLMLTLQAETFGAGGGGFDPASRRLLILDSVLGEGDERVHLVFGAVPAEAVRVGIRFEVDDEAIVDVLDIPDTIDAEMNAFVYSLLPNQRVTITAYDASGAAIASGEVGPGADDEPIGTPVPAFIDVRPEHGGTYWGVYLWVGASPDDIQANAAVRAAEDLGYTPSTGDIACDQDAATALGVDASGSRVAVYFEERLDAETAAALFDPAPVGVAEVTTYCLD